MKIFLDTARLEEIEEAQSSGILDGVTTNPSLMKKALEELRGKTSRINAEEYVKKILRTCKGPVSLEVTKTDFKGMVDEGKKLFKKFNPVAKNVYIKIPIAVNNNDVFEGLKAIKSLSSARIPVNCTLVFTPEQALLAAKAGAKIVSPFAGRVDDYLREKNHISFEKEEYFPAVGKREGERVWEDNGIVSGVDVVKKCVDLFLKYDLKCEVLAASIRNPRQLREVALAGAHIATVPIEVLRKSMIHQKTTEGMKKFVEDTVKEYADLAK